MSCRSQLITTLLLDIYEDSIDRWREVQADLHYRAWREFLVLQMNLPRRSGNSTVAVPLIHQLLNRGLKVLAVGDLGFGRTGYPAGQLSTIHQHGSVRDVRGHLADAVVIDEGAGISGELKSALLSMTERGTFVFILGGQN